MRFLMEQTFTCPVPGCGWAVLAERGDLFVAIRGYLERHARSTHHLGVDEVVDYIKLAGIH